MTALAVEPTPVIRSADHDVATSAPAVHPAPVRPRRSAGQPPAARPRSFTAATSGRSPMAGARGCVGEAAALPIAQSSPTTWRLTDRGVAVLVVTMLVIMTAALTVVGLTALRVTGDSYVGAGQSQVSSR